MFNQFIILFSVLIFHVDCLQIVGVLQSQVKREAEGKSKHKSSTSTFPAMDDLLESLNDRGLWSVVF